MQHNVYSNTAIKKITKASAIVAQTLSYIEPYVKPGISTAMINDLCHKFIVDNDARPACLNYRGFPKAVCTSRNDIVCHGIPNADEIVQEGDIINIDLVVEKDGYMGDASRTFILPSCRQDHIQLVQRCKQLRDNIIEFLKEGVTLYEIAQYSQDYIDSFGYFTTDLYCGHGVGRNLHEDPNIFFAMPSSSQHRKILKSYALKHNQVITIEPVINLGTSETYEANDGWTIRTTDGSYSAQWEHTVLITHDGSRILS